MRSIRTRSIPVLQKKLLNEAVLIEYRRLPHLEFLIRNTILHLGSSWSHTIVCGLLNYDFMKTMCATISPEIKVIQTHYDNLNQSTYSTMLASLDFWNLFDGEKILIYQEDSCMFTSNMDDFLKWDYIGAPWPEFYNIAPISVGNGGFSLRTRQCMIDVINTISINDTKVTNSITQTYMKNAGITVCPEDVYFSKNMQHYQIGQVADVASALCFSTENVFGKESLGGHNFWLSDPNWETRVNNIEYSKLQDKQIMKTPKSFIFMGNLDECKSTLATFNSFLSLFYLTLVVEEQLIPTLRGYCNHKIQVVSNKERDEWLKKTKYCLVVTPDAINYQCLCIPNQRYDIEKLL